MNRFLLLLLSTFPFFAHSVDYPKADDKQIISPWYTGPLLAGGGYILPTAVVNTQPYLYVFRNSRSYDSDWKSHDLLFKKWQVQPAFFFGTGITSWMDCSVTCNVSYIQQAGISQTNLSDTTFSISFQLYAPSKDSPWPAFRLSLKETFPTGSYLQLNPGNLFLFTGNGYYQSWIGLASSKIIKFFPSHPMNLRLNLGYAKNSHVKLKGATAYGGAPDTDAILKAGDNYIVSGAIEFSLTQRWVVALDVLYAHQNQIRYSGNPGHAGGVPVPLASPSSDLISLAPALEYNVNLNLGFLLASWFSVTGRNTGQFAGGAFSFTCSF